MGTTTTTGPWGSWRKRGRSQRNPVQEAPRSSIWIHMSTAMVVIAVAGILVSLNLNVVHKRWAEVEAKDSHAGSLYGFPFPWLETVSTTRFVDETHRMAVGGESNFEIAWPMALLNAAVLLLFMAALAWWLERRARPEP